MKVLELEGGPRVFVVGLGQVGSAISGALCQYGTIGDWELPTDWSSADATVTSISTAIGRLPPTRRRTAVVWAAGTCGMSSCQAECDASLATMTAAFEVLAAVRPESCHLLGSVGALAVGQPRWSGQEPSDSRLPYASLKLAEEALVRRSSLGDPVIHRTTSVYGPPNRPGRQGMVTALVGNASRMRTTQIHGRWSTLRNYVHADDVAAAVAREIVRPRGPGVHVLAAPRSHSIAELVGTVVRARRIPVPVRLVAASNADDLTVDPSAISPTFQARPLTTAVRQMVFDLRHVSRA